MEYGVCDDVGRVDLEAYMTGRILEIGSGLLNQPVDLARLDRLKAGESNSGERDRLGGGEGGEG